MKKQNGFTLIELLIVVAIVAILSAVAYPAYQDYVKSGKLIQATATLTDARQKYEQFYQDNQNTYIGAQMTRCPAPTDYFAFDCPVPPDADTYSIVANGTGDMTGFSYGIDQDNGKTTFSTIWGHVNKPCWITKRGGKC
jgi:type IV pilus assembly protein PilE